MRVSKDLLLGLIGGVLVTGVGLGTLGYVRIHALQSENEGLQARVKKADTRLHKLSQTQANLQQELENYKGKKAREYAQTIDSLMQATESAGIEALYEIGVKAMQEKDPPRAYFALSQVASADPGFKDIATRLPASKKAYDSHQRKQFEQNLAGAYAKALDHQLKGQFAQAKAEFQRVLGMKPAYKDAAARLASVNSYLATLQQTRDSEQKLKWLESTYRQGLKEQGLGRFVQAKQAFGSIVNYAPRYKDAAQRYKAVSARVPKTAQPVKAESANCYQKGVVFGNCAKTGAQDPSCKQMDLSHAPIECSGNPEFKKGLSSVADAENLNLLKSFPQWLKDL